MRRFVGSAAVAMTVFALMACSSAPNETDHAPAPATTNEVVDTVEVDVEVKCKGTAKLTDVQFSKEKGVTVKKEATDWEIVGRRGAWYTVTFKCGGKSHTVSMTINGTRPYRETISR